MKKENEIKRTSRYSANRRNYMNADGGYTYYRWDEESKTEIPVVLTPGEDGVTQEWVILLDEADHREDLIERYEEEARDPCFAINEARKSMDGGDFTADSGSALERIAADSNADPFEILFDSNAAENPEIEKLLRLMEKLTPAQIDLIYSLYGERRYATDIAADEGVTEAAIRNRRNKILNRLKKLFAEDAE